METETLSFSLDKTNESALIEPPSALNSSRLALLGSYSYYRSKAFNSTVGINPLITSASVLFSIATTLMQISTLPDPRQLHQDLSHEIRAFETKAHKEGYRSTVILAARYVLCTFIDEILLKADWANTEWANSNIWKEQTLLQTFHDEDWGGEKFFVILERSFEDPALYLDLLELLYLCLNLGFNGKYQQWDNGRTELVKISDHLYKFIRQERGEFYKNLLIAHASEGKPLLPSNHYQQHAWWPTSLVTVILILATFISFNQTLKITAAPITQALEKLLINTHTETGA
jgi:type IV/VI secretion system ImpK/VasF family protein